MGKFNGVLLATDFDDTYFPESGILPPANRQVVEYFKSEGGRFTIATGRCHRTFTPVLPHCPVNAPVILSNGAQLYDYAADAMLLEDSMPPAMSDYLDALFAQLPDLSVEAYYGEDVYIFNPNRWTRYHLERANVTAEECPISAMPQPWTKAILHQEHDLLLEAQRYLRAHHPDACEAIFSNFHMLELTAPGATKGGMVLKLAQRLGIDPKHIYCAGDNQNDIPMLAISAVPYAPGDCAQAVKDFGAHLLPPCEEGAIAALVEDLDRRY